jgi:hypothetical protein
MRPVHRNQGLVVVVAVALRNAALAAAVVAEAIAAEMVVETGAVAAETALMNIDLKMLPSGSIFV